MVTRIFLVRHGITGVPDEEQKPHDPLSKLGKKQMQRLAKRLQAVEKVHLVFSSEYERSIESAEVIAKALKCNVQHNESLNEIGVWTSPTQLHNPNTSPMQYQEAIRVLRKAQEQAVKFLKHVSVNHPEETIVVVAHGNIIRATIAQAIKADVETTVRMSVHNASLSILEYDTNGVMPFFRLTLFNDTSHLS